jgi:phospholipase/carboxylesterase
MEYKPLKYIFVPAEAAPASAVTLLLLHGTGGDENDLLPTGRRFGRGVNLLSVRGNVTEQGMPRFFRRLAMGVFDEADVRFRSGELADFLMKQSVALSFDANRLVALGYSNGANIAGALLLLFPDLLAGAVLLRPMQPLGDYEPVHTSRHSPVLLLSGEQDTLTTPADARRYAALLRSLGFQVSDRHLPLGHALSQLDFTLAQDWFNTRFAQPGDYQIHQANK